MSSCVLNIIIKLDKVMCKMKSLMFAMITIAIIAVCFASCGDDDDYLKVETSMYVVLKYGNESVSGSVFVFPQADDYDPLTFKIEDGNLGNLGRKATINRQNGSTIHSIAYIPCPKGKYGCWEHYDIEPDIDWITSCTPGTFYVVAAYPGFATLAWQSRTVTIKANNGNAQEFVFTQNRGYQE